MERDVTFPESSPLPNLPHENRLELPGRTAKRGSIGG